jgi:hypothetical protein
MSEKWICTRCGKDLDISHRCSICDALAGNLLPFMPENGMLPPDEAWAAWVEGKKEWAHLDPRVCSQPDDTYAAWKVAQAAAKAMLTYLAGTGELLSPEEVEEAAINYQKDWKVNHPDKLIPFPHELFYHDYIIGMRVAIAKAQHLRDMARMEGMIKLETSSESDTIEDGFGSEWSAWCPMCHQKSMSVVRPGKAQCNNCG